MVARGNVVTVYMPAKSGSPTVPVVACLAGRQTGMTLIPAPSPSSRRQMRESLALVVVAGPIAAYVVNQLTGVDTATSELVVADVASGRILREAPAGHSVDGGIIFDERLSSLATTSRGSVAWIEQRREGRHKRSASVYSAPPTGHATLLDEGPAIGPESLTLSHGTLSWSDGAGRRTAAMP